jgi:tRNA A37 threonylcarbamoyltransferase TsaD
MLKPKAKLNTGNVGKLLKSEAVQANLKERADRIAAAAGPGMEASVKAGPNRARASVFTATPEAMLAEAIERRLTRAIDAGRG